MTGPGDLLTAARDVLEVLARGGHDACLIGGLAVSRWGEPRATVDVDVSVLAPYGEEQAVLDTLLSAFRGRLPDARTFALSHRVVLLESGSGVKIDAALATLAFERDALARASDWAAHPALTIRTCAAEHLIVYKLVAARPRDIGDVEGIVRRQRTHLDVDVVRRWGSEFAELKEDPDLLRPFEQALLRL
jgi:hypothetical protein